MIAIIKFLFTVTLLLGLIIEFSSTVQYEDSPTRHDARNYGQAQLAGVGVSIITNKNITSTNNKTNNKNDGNQDFNKKKIH